MLRLAIVLLLIAGLSQFKPAADKALSARSITGMEAQRLLPGLVELKGTVLECKRNTLGGSVITLSTVDGQQPVLVIPPGVDLRLPQFGQYISATGKMIAKGVVSCEQIRVLRTPLDSRPWLGTTSVEQAVTGQRVSIHIRSFRLQSQRTRNGCYFVVFKEQDGTERTGLLSETTEIPTEVTVISGQLLNSGIFFIEQVQ